MTHNKRTTELTPKQIAQYKDVFGPTPDYTEQAVEKMLQSEEKRWSENCAQAREYARIAGGRGLTVSESLRNTSTLNAMRNAFAKIEAYTNVLRLLRGEE